MASFSRREFLHAAAAGSLGCRLAGGFADSAVAQLPGSRPRQDEAVQVLNPRTRAPLSFIIDDSTCLVNLAHFCIPQFAEVFPDRYKQDWRKLPREIPDGFVRKFGQWCREHGVKGKYSIVPYPACVGWIDKEMPGWTRRELEQSLALVRDFMTVDWDIHPEMVTHTWVINTKTGRPYQPRNADYMENWGWSVGRSTDELADYLSYALRLIKNVGLPCEGVTTPGGFGSRALPELAQATLESCRDVFQTEIPHYFRHLYTDQRSVAPQVQYASGLDGDDPRCVVSIIGCTGDWFGGWDGLTPGDVDRFITKDLQGGRLPEVIDSGEPAVLVCHWPGIYYNGQELGFEIFKEVVRRLDARYDHLLWMKNSEIARYWAAKELTQIEKNTDHLALQAPFASPDFTVQCKHQGPLRPHLEADGKKLALKHVEKKLDLKSGKYYQAKDELIACFNLPKGASRLVFAG